MKDREIQSYTLYPTYRSRGSVKCKQLRFALKHRLEVLPWVFGYGENDRFCLSRCVKWKERSTRKSRLNDHRRKTLNRSGRMGKSFTSAPLEWLTYCPAALTHRARINV